MTAENIPQGFEENKNNEVNEESEGEKEADRN